MLLILVNCQNVFMEKCESKRLRVIVEAAELVQPAHVIAWSLPTVEATGKKIGKDSRSEYDLAVYPEIAKLNLPTSIITDLTKLPKEFYQEIKREGDVLLCGCNAQDWMTKIAIEMWNVNRVRSSILMEGWFTIGAPGAHGDAMNELTRHFGAGVFKPWASIKEPILKMRAELREALAKTKKNPKT